MSNVKPKTPPIIFGYWRPWKEDSNLGESYLDYVKDVSLANYTANTVGQYISLASKIQVQTIDDLGQKVGFGMKVLSDNLNAVSDQVKGLSAQMEDISDQISFVNRNLEILNDQQRLTNILLKNIRELLRVPDSEKERQHCIELGLKFYINAQKDDDLFADALEELLKAEQLMRQDYFVLHRIGLIYLHSVNHINLQKAFDYFTKAAKYASVESDPAAARLANLLAASSPHTDLTNINNEEVIKFLAADSYEKAAFTAYVSGDFKSAVKNQAKAADFNICPENYFLLAKYQTRTKEIDSCVKNISLSIDMLPEMVLAVFKDLDLLNEPEVLKIIEEKNEKANEELTGCIKKCNKYPSDLSVQLVSELTKSGTFPYHEKIYDLEKFDYNFNEEILGPFTAQQQKIRDLREKCNSTALAATDKKINSLKENLDDCHDKSFTYMEKIYEECLKQYNEYRLQIGSKYAGGIVFHLDKSGNHGFVVAETDYPQKAIWGKVSGWVPGYEWKIGDGKKNTELIVENSSWETGFFSTAKKPVPTAARLCKELSLNGFNDWYLPAQYELQFICDRLLLKGIGNFSEDYYWTSNSDGDYQAWTIFFTPKKEHISAVRNALLRFRPVRAF